MPVSVRVSVSVSVWAPQVSELMLTPLEQASLKALGHGSERLLQLPVV